MNLSWVIYLHEQRDATSEDACQLGKYLIYFIFI